MGGRGELGGPEDSFSRGPDFIGPSRPQTSGSRSSGSSVQTQTSPQTQTSQNRIAQLIAKKRDLILKKALREERRREREREEVEKSLRRAGRRLRGGEEGPGRHRWGLN